MATPKPLTDFDPLAAVDVQQNDVLFVVDVNDTSQSTAGSTKTLALSALFGSMVDAVLSGVLTFSAAVSKLIPGATSFSIRNHADSADNLLIDDAGNVTARTTLKIAAAISKLIPGATSFSIRNTADSADNVLVDDAGNTTIRTALIAGKFLPLTGGWVVRNSGDTIDNFRVFDSTGDASARGALSGTALLVSGDTVKSHIYFTASVTPSAPQNGMLWWDGTNLKLRTGGVTKTVTVA